jgi:KDO2-lipid IV(A) lauroyltransferase
MRTRLPRKIEYGLLRWLARGYAALARRLPLHWVHRLGNAAGRIVYALTPRRQRRADRNLVTIFGDRFDASQRKRIRLQSTQNLAKTMLELFRLPAMSDAEWGRQVTVRGREHVDKAFAEGRGAVLVTAHFGNWELVAATCARLGWVGKVVARDANDPATAAIINSARNSVGVQVLAREEIREMLRTLRKPNFLGILPDQHALSGGIWVDFLGRPASTFTGPATLARATGAAIIPCFGRRRPDDTIDVYLLPPLELPRSEDREADVRAGTEVLNGVLGNEIRKHPEQWVWLHNRWRTAEPGGERLEAGNT